MLAVTIIHRCSGTCPTNLNEVLSYTFVLCSCNDSVLLPYDQDNVPCQIILSQVCSKWRQVALSTGALWSNVRICGEDDTQDYEHGLFLYRAWIDRAGAHLLTVTIDFSDDRLDLQGVFQDFVLPFQFKKLSIIARYRNLPRLSSLPTLDVEEFAISLLAVHRIENFAAPPFMNKQRSICLRGPYSSDWGQAMLKELCSSLPWHELRSLECHSFAVSLSTLLDVLRQAQSLKECHLTIHDTGSAPLMGISMPGLRRLALEFVHVDPDIIIPLFAVPNLTALDICSYHRWSSYTYGIIKKALQVINSRNFNFIPCTFPSTLPRF